MRYQFEHLNFSLTLFKTIKNETPLISHCVPPSACLVRRFGVVAVIVYDHIINQSERVFYLFCAIFYR